MRADPTMAGPRPLERRVRSRSFLLLLTFLGVAGVACFSTIGPGTKDPLPPAETATLLRGQVIKRWGNGNNDFAPNWAVLVTWYERDRDGDGAPERLHREVVLTNSDAVYTSKFLLPEEPVRVEARALRCDYDADGQPDCCLSPNGCPGGCPPVWTSPLGVPIERGVQQQLNLIVNCIAD